MAFLEATRAQWLPAMAANLACITPPISMAMDDAEAEPLLPEPVLSLLRTYLFFREQRERERRELEFVCFKWSCSAIFATVAVRLVSCDRRSEFPFSSLSIMALFEVSRSLSRDAARSATAVAHHLKYWCSRGRLKRDRVTLPSDTTVSTSATPCVRCIGP